jgi:periplasmic divalent cation tolerance protein
MAAVFAYVTAKDREEAERIGRALVEERLAACVNILDGMRSIYRWQEKVEDAAETVLLVKTDASRTQAVIDKVKQLHSYSCPCVVVWPLTGGNPEYLDWISRESRDA